MFNISIASYEDHSRIIDLGKEFELTPYSVDPIFDSITNTMPSMTLSEQLLSSTSMKILVAKLQGVVIGFLAYTYEDRLSNYLKLEDLGAPRCASIIFLAVDHKYRRHSIGSSLLKACKANCFQDGVEVLRVSTDYGNFGAWQLYQKFGFHVDMNFHIYRIYKHQITSTLSVQAARGMQPATLWAEPLESVVSRRPAPWYYTPHLKRSGVEKYMLYQLKDQAKSNKLSVIQKILYNKTVGMILRQEKEKESYYELKGSVWTIIDLMENGTRGEQLPAFMQHILSNLPNFLMAEIFVNASDYETQRILREANMHYVYGGISLSTADLSSS
ncbi:MAG: GNAT family N-acetyltransferase [Brevinema sp.]